MENSLDFRYDVFPSGSSELIKGDGDGTVNLKSLASCQAWQTQQTEAVTLKTFQNVDHMGLLSNVQAVNYVQSIVHSIKIGHWI